MKKLIASLFLIFLTGCQFINSEKTQKTIDAFIFNEECPRICWLGINPDKTTVEEAKSILSASNQIDHTQTEISDTGMYVIWLGESGTLSIPIGIVFENDRVKEINFGQLPVTVDEFIKLLGKPDKISIEAINGSDGIHIPYVIYYQSQNAMIYVSENLQNGPDADNMGSLELNTDIDVSNPPSEWAVFQPWLGYGHLKEYLPTLKLP